MKKLVQRVVQAPKLYLFFMRIRPFTGRFFFLIVCIAGLIWYAVYTNYVIGRLRVEATNVTTTYAELIRVAISEQMSGAQVNAIFEEVILDADIPIVITDTAWVPTMWKNVTDGGVFNRRTIAPDDTSRLARLIVEAKVYDFRKRYRPKPIRHSMTGEKLGYLVYGDSDLVRGLAWMPLIETGLVTAFTVFVYLAFHNIRVTERSNLWVGLAKETAHQLGTPISSLMGWVEYLRSVREADEPIDPETFIAQVSTICGDMEHDLTRLRKITSRFSQIGSKPARVPHDLNEILGESMKYFTMRLPLLGKRIEIRSELNPIPDVAVNRDLIEWVFENLFKNAMDAISGSRGFIEVRTEFIEVDKLVRVYHRDNGKGIQWEDKKKIFSPGYTTKKRGWGLGLTLAKRIVEDYHGGQIYVRWSQKGQGTVFCVDLPVTAV